MIQHYTRVFFVKNDNVRPTGTDKLFRLDAKPEHVHIYRDLDVDPHTLVVELRAIGKVREISEVPWNMIATARRKLAAEVVKLPSAPQAADNDQDGPQSETGQAEALEALKVASAGANEAKAAQPEQRAQQNQGGQQRQGGNQQGGRR